jgi:hypothetical protein
MREVAAEGAGVAVCAGGASFASDRADIERDTDDFVSE